VTRRWESTFFALKLFRFLIGSFRGDEKDREERERRIKAAPKVAQIKKPRSPGAFLN